MKFISTVGKDGKPRPVKRLTAGEFDKAMKEIMNGRYK